MVPKPRANVFNNVVIRKEKKRHPKDRSESLIQYRESTFSWGAPVYLGGLFMASSALTRQRQT